MKVTDTRKKNPTVYEVISWYMDVDLAEARELIETYLDDWEISAAWDAYNEWQNIVEKESRAK